MTNQTNMRRINEFFKKFPSGVLSTCNKEKVYSRLFKCLWSEGNLFYFCTSNQKAVYQQLKANAHASFCTFRPNFSHVMSVSGPVSFIEDLSLKQRALEEDPIVHGIYKEATNPALTLFCLRAEEGERYSFAEGKQPIDLD